MRLKVKKITNLKVKKKGSFVGIALVLHPVLFTLGGISNYQIFHGKSPFGV